MCAAACWICGFARPAIAQRPSCGAFWPEVSPDGQKILYLSPGRAGPIHVVKADGSDPHDVAPGTRAAWFPDGRQILAVARSETGDRLVVMNADGTDPDTLPLSHRPPLWRPRVSPDEKAIVFGDLSPEDRPGVFHIIALDGTRVRDIHPSAAGHPIEPTWSHDGRLAFVAFSKDSTGTIRSTTLYTMNGDGGEERAVATLPDAAQWISWSPDDRKIALQDDATRKDGKIVDGKITVVDLATGAIHPITHHDRPYLDETPDWSPDGHIYFQSNRDGAYAIYRMNDDGSGQRRIAGCTE